ncbi:MAG: protein translocase subunit SecD [Planctomycetota bacterium]|nr:protein translocase subunit SecD [Planctomycetota bacterium]
MSWSFLGLLAQAPNGTDKAAEALLPFYQEGWFITTVAILAVVLPFVVGNYLAKVWRMPDHGWRFGVVLFAITAGLVVCTMAWPPKLGIDLSGGVELVYETIEEQKDLAAKLNLESDVKQLQTLLQKLNPDIAVTSTNDNLIQVAMPADVPDLQQKVEKEIEQLQLNVKLDLQSPSVKDGKQLLTYKASQIDPAGESKAQMQLLITAINRRINPGGQKEVSVREYGGDAVMITVPEVDAAEVGVIKDKISTAGKLEFRIVANRADSKHQSLIAAAETGTRPNGDVMDGDILVGKWVKLDPKEDFGGTDWMTLRTNRLGENEVLVAVDEQNVTGKFINRAFASNDPETARPAVSFTFDTDGASLFGALTAANLPIKDIKLYRHLGIVLDGTLFSAPTINSVISGQGQITGKFDQKQVDFLVELLNSGELETALNKVPVSETNISAQLGDDTIRSGGIAMGVSTLVVLLFMAFYYRFAGIVANICVVLNVMLVVALMILIKAPFTLAGLAGLVLSIGMAVDANVLIYERMREEMQRGAALRMAIRNGFARAMSTIVDSNLTTLITAIVLYAIGTDQLRGFAITLILGLLLNLFTAVFCARVIFDVAERRRWITKLNMMRIFSETNFNFIGPMKICIVASSVIIAIGFFLGFQRGAGLFDIDFTGGTSLQVVLKEGQAMDVAEVRKLLNTDTPENPRLDDVTVSTVGSTDGASRYFKIDTSEENKNEVKTRLAGIFGDRMQVYNMTYKIDKSGKATPEAPSTDATTTPADGSKAAPDSTPPTTTPAATPPADATPATTPPPADTPPTTTPAATDPAPATTPPPNTPAPTTTPAAPATTPSTTPAPDAPATPAAGTKQSSNRSLPVPSLSNLTASAFSLAGPGQLLLLQEDATKVDAPKTDAAKSTETKAAVPAVAEPAATTPAGAPPAATTAPPATTPSAASDATTKSPTAPTSPLLGTSETPTSVTPAVDEAAIVDRFADGTTAKLEFTEGISEEALRSKLTEDFFEHIEKQNIDNAEFDILQSEGVVGSGAYKTWIYKSTLDRQSTESLLNTLKAELSTTPVFLGASNIGGRVADHTKMQAIYALLVSAVLIVIYVWYRFQNIAFGLAAVVAVLHDAAVAISAVAVSSFVAPYFGWALVDPFKISLDVVAAILTIVGFSLNDTIVIFDRIREIRGKSPEITADMVNKAVNQTLGRTILTSGTVLLVTIILYIYGGQEIHAFAFTMLVGLISGTYSTVYIAAPLVLWLRRSTTAASRGALPGLSASKRSKPSRA